ncbi:hypothetical protein BDZ97DRAFT_1665912 [Flammula alnicola]|nr:hypothetical protein BDZ97DRAFT_1665912 [Flammula alnicola]
MLFSSAVQSSTISLFSSTGSDPLSLFGTSTDKALPADSFIHLLHDGLSSPLPTSPRSLLRLPTLDDKEDDDSQNKGYQLDQTVLHIQSPTIRATYIQCPPITPTFGVRDRSGGLGIKHPWMHLQVRNLSREWAFEVGIVDHAGRAGTIRLSTFQKKPTLKMGPNSHPLLLLPLSFPSRSTHPLTPWSTINIHFPSLLPYFYSPHLLEDERHEDAKQRTSTNVLPRRSSAVPSGSYAHVSYVRVYANCRLRRIWFGESGPTQKVPWEFELYSGD